MDAVSQIMFMINFKEYPGGIRKQRLSFTRTHNVQGGREGGRERGREGGREGEREGKGGGRDGEREGERE